MADSREDFWTKVSSVQSAETSGTFGEDSSDRDTGDRAAFHGRKASDEVTSPLKEPPGVFLPSHEALPSGHSEIEAASEESTGEVAAPTGSWWASITTSVKKVAEGVAKDLDELNESFQKLLEESDEEETEGNTVGKQKPQCRAPAEEPNPESSKTAAHRNEILSRLEGEDTELDTGLKAIDEQVEQLTGGLSRAIGSVWGTARSGLVGGISFGQRVAERMEEAAKEMSGQVEASVKDSQRGVALAAGRTSQFTVDLASRAEQGLEALGRRAAELLDPAGEEKADGREPSFEARFEACGAAFILEEMEKQSNECARLLNRIRPVLAPEARNSLEDTLNRLLPVLTLQDHIQQSFQDGAAGYLPTDDEGCAVITEFQGSGVKQAAQIAAGAEKALSSGRQEEPAPWQVEEPNIIEVAILKHICAEGVKYLAELCGLCAERLQAMGSSLSAEVEHKQAANDCILWPDSPLEKAKYMHMQAMIMLASLEGLAEAFQQSLKQVAQVGTAQAPAKEGPLQELTAPLIRNLKLSRSTAAMRLQDCVKGLIYVVALTSEEVQTALRSPE